MIVKFNQGVNNGVISVKNKLISTQWNLLTEECHIFNCQYETANMIAQIIIDNLNKGIYTFPIELSNCDSIKKVIVEIQLPSNSDIYFNGQIYDIDLVNKTANMRIVLTQYHLRQLTQKQIKNYLFNIVSHELMHNHIFVKQFEKTKAAAVIPSNYNAIVNAMHDNTNNPLIYQFTYALYSTYYQESQAIISQAWPSFKIVLERNKVSKIKKTHFQRYITLIEPYQVFMQTLSLCDFLLKNKAEYEGIKNFAEKSNLLKKENFKTTIRYMYNNAKKCLRKIINSCYYYAYKNGYVE